MTEAERKANNRKRQNAVNRAWTREKNLVKQGKGTRDWTQEEQKQLIRNGRVKGYQGHHMKNVQDHNKQSYVGDANNIQFLNRKEHLDAHERNFKNKTNGRYDPKTGTTENFGHNAPSIKETNLSNPIGERSAKIQDTKRLSEQRAKAAQYAQNAKAKKQAQAQNQTPSKTLSSQRKTAQGKEKLQSGSKSQTLDRDRKTREATKAAQSKLTQSKRKPQSH